MRFRQTTAIYGDVIGADERAFAERKWKWSGLVTCDLFAMANTVRSISIHASGVGRPHA
jgi:hypothetical protein